MNKLSVSCTVYSLSVMIYGGAFVIDDHVYDIR